MDNSRVFEAVFATMQCSPQYNEIGLDLAFCLEPREYEAKVTINLEQAAWKNVAQKTRRIEFEFDGTGWQKWDSEWHCTLLHSATSLESLYINGDSNITVSLTEAPDIYIWPKLRSLYVEETAVTVNVFTHFLQAHSSTLTSLKIKEGSMEDDGSWSEVFGVMANMQALNYLYLQLLIEDPESAITPGHIFPHRGLICEDREAIEAALEHLSSNFCLSRYKSRQFQVDFRGIKRAFRSGLHTTILPTERERIDETSSEDESSESDR